MSFQPDTMLVHEVVPSPNHDARAGGRAPDMLLLHYTGMFSAEGALKRLCSAEAKVSCHYFVTEEGRIIQCVPEELRAWHAGQGAWGNDTDINSCSIGIEIVNPGHDYGYPDFPRRQIAAVTALCRAILRRRLIKPERVLAHSDIAPVRKQDPGEKFPWRTLHNAGVGHWVEPGPIKPGPRFERCNSSDGIRAFQSALRDYGYDVPVSGDFDERTRVAVIAFQRHFRPALCDGKLDSSTLVTLRRLIDALPDHRPSSLETELPLDE